MFYQSKLLTVSTLCVFCGAMALSAAPANLSALKMELSSRSTPESQLDFLKTALSGQSLANKAALGASIIQSAPPEAQKEMARNVAQILAGLKDGTSDTPQLASLLTKALPRDLAVSVAGSIAIGAGKSDPDNLPLITAAVIVSRTSTIDQAGLIAQEVVASVPIEQASLIAGAIGAKFTDSSRLAEQAPQIAVGITRAILSLNGTVDQTRSQTAESVAALTVLLPGSVLNNKELITKIGTEVATLIATDHPGLATTIVGITTAALQSAAGTSDITSVLDNFRDAFKTKINDPVIQDKLDQVVSEIKAGTSDKSIKPLEDLVKNSQSQSQSSSGGSTSSGSRSDTGGSTLFDESNVLNP